MARDPFQGFSFLVDVGGIQGFFTSVDGLGSETEVVVSKVLNQKGHEAQLKLAGRLNWGDVTLKRGLTADMGFWEWRQAVMDTGPTANRKNVTITLMDRSYSPVAEWNLVNAWPSKVSAATFSADSNDMQMEEVTLVHEGVTRKGVAGGAVAG